VICGHNYAKTFSPIRWVAIGAEVTFTNVDGTVIRYQVSNIETVQPTAVAQMVLNDKNSDSSASWDLTLFTCNMGGQTRCAVRCVRMEDSIGS
jgi:sortase A